MAPHSILRWLVAAVALAAMGLSAFGADASGNLITNGGFEAGMQIWKGDGKIVLLPDGNRVCEIEASKSRMKDLKQEFHLKQLQQVEVVFRARSINYTGPGLRISIHQPGSGSMIYNKQLPEDGSWAHLRILYTRAAANVDTRELNIATLLGTGQVQIDDVEVREPSKVVENQPPEPVVPATPAPAATPAPPAKPFPPIAVVKPPAPPVAPAPSTPAPQPSPSVPAGTFGSLEQILNSAPPEILQKIQNEATAAKGKAELDKYFSANIKGKPARLQVHIDQNRLELREKQRFLVHVTDHPATAWNGRKLDAWMWIKFSEESVPADEKIGVGTEPTLSGLIVRCQVAKGGQFHLDVDLGQTKLEGP
ncbi:MAG: carbohydrate-binding protein CenC [Chthoniobacter sp.]|nr:carbohydrate-binding protein CenC [Chthoniobacter sp.]